MQNKKSFLEEVDKTWKLARLIKEANLATNLPKEAQSVQMNPQQVQNNIQATMDKGMAELIKSLPNILQNFTATSGDKDRQLDLPGNLNQPVAIKSQAKNGQIQTQNTQIAEEKKLKFDENKFRSHIEGELNEAGILGLVASAPSILQLGAKFATWTGKKTNSQFLQKWGKGIADAGYNLHHKYIGVLEKVVAPFMQGQSKEAIHQAAEAMFMTLVAGLFAGGVAVPDALTGVKAQELTSYVKKIAPKALNTLGFA